MLVFGHVGITAAVARIADIAFPVSDPVEENNGVRAGCSRFVNRFRDSSGHIDYRMVIIGSMLPDIIDKPLFLIFQNSSYFDGRGISHSLLVQVLILAAGFIFKRPWLLLLAFGSLMHLVLDYLWANPVALFWPFMGWFTPRGSEGWLSSIWEGLISNPRVYVPEIVGLLVVAWFGYRILRGRKILSFLKHGNID